MNDWLAAAGLGRDVVTAPENTDAPPVCLAAVHDLGPSYPPRAATSRGSGRDAVGGVGGMSTWRRPRYSVAHWKMTSSTTLGPILAHPRFRAEMSVLKFTHSS